MRERVLSRLTELVTRVTGDPRFRRALRYEPAVALGTAGLPADLAPESLPVRHYTVSATIDEAHIFGPSISGARVQPSLEVRLVAYGAKPMALAHGPESDLAALRAWGERNGLVGLLSPHQGVPDRPAAKSRHSDLLVRQPARAGSGAWRGLVLAQDENQAILGWLSLLFGWDRFLGSLLGYPACCGEAFEARWPAAAEHHRGDVAALLAATSGPGPHPWQTNVFARYLGPQLTLHFPCRLDCEESLLRAERTVEALAFLEPATLEGLREALATVCLYTDDHGVFYLGKAEGSSTEDGLLWRYDPSRMWTTDQRSDLAAALRASTEVLAGADGVLRAGDLQVPGFGLDFRPEAG